ncbi:hypothetical protein QKU48_gp0594 [Fadolivirus algeromassiliense]|jgi:hypothetical protein|uniref:Uncharacterized protein n=1 Tax=Fadolivirus FV1/VV64 TaxID=3070911 RepID=A0A7D3V5M8_9VIRU|nr:hypothetical protein QKU48_gp0594 [Fadolivirus algeromassiliense]QKF94052.1 hypothetical protein Fadolivirus_1_594 [Fadolivirus FV1/VV64]
MSTNNSAKKNIMLTEKLLNILKEVDKIDNRCERKFINNVKDISFYNKLLEESNEKLVIITNNLK